MELTSTQRKALRGQAHHLKPHVFVGQGGLTPNVLASIEQALDAHELIKVRFVAMQAAKGDLVQAISEDRDCACAGTVGHVAIFFRPHPDVDKRRVKVPQ